MSDDGQQLWCAVIEQAITDATQPLAKRLSVRMDQLRAREWLTVPNQDFDEVCALAGIEADKVRAVATLRIETARKNDPDYSQRTDRRYRGVGHNFRKAAPDRSISVARESA